MELGRAPAGVEVQGVAIALRKALVAGRSSGGIRAPTSPADRATSGCRALRRREPRDLEDVPLVEGLSRQQGRTAPPAPLALLLLAAMGLAYHVFFDRSGLPDLESFIRFTPPTIGEVYDARGAVLIRLAREYRRVVSYDEVPPVLRHAILSAEDKHFFIHSGVDYRSLPRVLQKKSEASPEPADGGVVAECAECNHQPSRPAKSGRLPGPSKTRVKLFTFRCGGSRAGTGPG